MLIITQFLHCTRAIGYSSVTLCSVLLCVVTVSSGSVEIQLRVLRSAVWKPDVAFSPVEDVQLLTGPYSRTTDCDIQTKVLADLVAYFEPQ